jgi:hypothetical protein
MIVAICCTCGYLALILIPELKSQIYEPVFLTVLFAIVSYPVASAFLGLFEIAANTILMCYCLEKELVKGTATKCPPGLRHFIKNYVMDSSSAYEEDQGKLTS